MAKHLMPQLEDRIRAIWSDLERFLDERVAELKKQCPGVPEAVLRAELTGNFDCECRAVLSIKRKEAEAANV
ncbi:hypothetical protein [Bradyrhizobium sp. SEMIA]|uniref:hypothetical protein n=1 Tax=Bradyrhizobium sp. SEMIA TaxID=2597515 RepID=UPI0018A39965|nr:hypothetical protein [Bradyrhizobium sp. SEMIA]QOG17917.1 hypothetical protein FOM02_11755 [Bradyrhizobium sp. SEMIA]